MTPDEARKALLTHLLSYMVVGERPPKTTRVRVEYDNGQAYEWHGEKAVVVAAIIGREALASPPPAFPEPDVIDEEGCASPSDGDVPPVGRWH